MAPAKKQSPKKKKIATAGKKKTSALAGNKDFLRVIIKHGKSKKDIKKLVDLASKEEINAICEILFNAMRGNVRLTPSVIKQLQRNRKACDLLIRRDVSFTRKKRILKGQAGGFGSNIVTPIVESVVGRLSR